MLKRLGNFLRPESKAVETFSASAFYDLFAQPTASGVTVTPTTAMQTPAIYSSVKVLSEAVAQLPLHVYRRNDDGGRDRDPSHPVASLLKLAPNGWSSAFDFRVQMQQDLLLYGNAYAYVNRLASGKVSELLRLPAEAVTVRADSATSPPTYQVNTGPRTETYGPENILHLRTLGHDPHVGASPIVLNRESIAIVMVMEQHAARLFGNGARPGGVIEYGKTLTAKVAQRLRESFDAQHGGSSKAGRTLILEDGMQFKPLAFSSVDSQFLELRRFQMAEVARIYRIPLHLLNDLERTTHANAESLGRQFLSFTLLPWLQIWEQAINRTLFGKVERRTFYAEFLTDELARADLAQRMQAYAQAVNNGILNPNEVRRAEGRPAYEGGDKFRLPMNTENPATTPETGAGDGT